MNVTNQTGRITTIQPLGSEEFNGRMFNKFRVGLDDGDQEQRWIFSAVGDFKFNIGDTIPYKTKGGGRASVDYEKLKQATQPAAPINNYSRSAKSDDTQTYIIRQSSLKAAVDYHANSHTKSEYDVIETARKFVNFVNNG